MGIDQALYSTKVFTASGFKAATVLTSGGKITEVRTGRSAPEGTALEDLGSKILMPGLVDMHVHINEPGRTHWEGFETATRAAAAGGITTLIDMPLNSSPVTTSPAAFEEKLAAARGKIQVNCGFWGGVVPGNAGQLQPLLDSGVLGIKAFLTHSGIEEFPNVQAADLRKAMPLIAAKGIPLLVHCELDSLHDGLAHFKQHPFEYQAFLRSRPAHWEQQAIELMIDLCRKYRCKTHIVHLSAATALPVIQAARAEGLPLTVETCPHYLYFHAEAIPDRAPLYKCAPPIREKANQEQLWAALRNGLIDCIATDHSPAPPELKAVASGNLYQAWGGISSLQFLLPAVWTPAQQRGFEVPQLVQWLCTRPAEIAGLSHRKGKIAPGYDADLVVWDPDAGFTVQKEMIMHRHKSMPYLGEVLQGIVLRTYVGGHKVYDQGQWTDADGQVISG